MELKDYKETIKEGIDKAVSGELINIENEVYYKISNNDQMRPFFMTIVSDSNHWMFISSNGGLTAGRKNAEYAFFPYYTDDKITENADITGSKSIFHLKRNGQKHTWEPFSDRFTGSFKITRNLYKNQFGNKVIFEEINHDLDLIFQYKWSSSNRFGFIKESKIINNNESVVNVKFLDGLQNIIPYGVPSEHQNSRSNLVDAYKRSELEPSSGIGIYALSAIIVDKAEPSEALKANIAWSLGIEKPTYLLSSRQVDSFRSGNEVKGEDDVKAEKGAYFISSNFHLEAYETKEWIFVANVNQTASNILEISTLIQNDKNLRDSIKDDIESGTQNLIDLVGAADGLQKTADSLTNMRHFSNTLFNIMRGGIFDDGYAIEKNDFIKYISGANKEVFKEKRHLLESFHTIFSLEHLKDIANVDSNMDFKRLCTEYLPLKFSRRHGDPSRPWNRFSINTKNEIDGSKVLDYEGNWRDIFQNWEALAHSYPQFIEGMIHKFLNASTFDGYNPYRVTKSGFDWEVIEENDPWSYIGYWGDHQIIYLLKFLEFIEDYYPGTLSNRFNEEVFVYANVPYKIKPFNDILNNPKDTIDFDYKLNAEIEKRRAVLGADGALTLNQNNRIYRVNLIEKLLATVLAKISNFIPEGGIWLNTQRPEWNDANNALVGNGVSMVTLYYLRRFMAFLHHSVSSTSIEKIDVSEELKMFFNKVLETLENNQEILNRGITDKDRKTVLDGLGQAGSDYRNQIYKKGFSGNKIEINKKELLSFIEITQNYLEHSIKANRRSDNMYHAYNLMTIESEHEVSISYLGEMLEGQVAVLSSGYLSPKEALRLLDGLKASSLFRDDQYSYILYPNKNLPKFLDKNRIPKDAVNKSALLIKLIEDGNRQIIEQDLLGNFHFNGNFNNANSLKSALNELDDKYYNLVKEDKNIVLEIFESVFDHKSFTGRSGTFFGYEGLGSIYWHMVSKLLLAVQENCWLAINTNADKEIIGKLLDHYYEIGAGIGVHKSPDLYGAFPTDAYSHTPAHKGAQQPGMTGQVKEDIISRFGELGVFVKNGQIVFNPALLQGKEFLNEPSVFAYKDVHDNYKTIELGIGSLAFTKCQVPIIYKVAQIPRVEIVLSDGTIRHYDNLQLNRDLSKSIFERCGKVERIIISVNK